jgi:preprotein translocase subunit SecG
VPSAPNHPDTPDIQRSARQAGYALGPASDRRKTPMLTTFLNILHVFVCLFLILVVLLQQGRGGGMGSAFGGATAQVFGGRGAGNVMTRLTAICAAVFMLTSMSLAWLSSAGDRELREFESSQDK